MLNEFLKRGFKNKLNNDQLSRIEKGTLPSTMISQSVKKDSPITISQLVPLESVGSNTLVEKENIVEKTIGSLTLEPIITSMDIDALTEEKGEFEKNEDYIVRMEKNIKHPLYFFDEIPKVINYNAETETGEILLRGNIVIASVSKDGGSYTGQNAYGATVTVSKTYYSSWEVDGGLMDIKNGNYSSAHNGIFLSEDFKSLIKIPLEIAKTKKLRIRYAIILCPDGDYMQCGKVSFDNKDPTISDPSDYFFTRKRVKAKIIAATIYDELTKSILDTIVLDK